MSNSIKKFNGINEDSIEFCIQVNENTFMDLKQILLEEKRRKMFRVECVLYILVLNMDRYNKIEITKELTEFAISETKLSRAFIFKVIKTMCDAGMIERLKRGWYRINCVSDEKIIRDKVSSIHKEQWGKAIKKQTT